MRIRLRPAACGRLGGLPCWRVHRGRLSREHWAASDEGTMGVSNTDRAHQNREYVRRLLKKKMPEFAAVLERAVADIDDCYCASATLGPADEKLSGVL
jgi:hypothetical protein